MTMLLTCKEDYEKTLAREIISFDLASEREGKGWVLTKPVGQPALQQGGGLCFACEVLEEPVEIQGASVNNFTEVLLNTFLAHLGSKKIDTAWGYRFFSSSQENLIHHAGTVGQLWLEKLKKKMSRVAKLAQEGIPRGPEYNEGFFVYITDFNKAFVSFRAFSQGQQRMKMDPDSPSRSYLKVEEAFYIFAKSPGENNTVVDLGAAPGGWSLSALKRGAHVFAVDNGPLKEPVLSHPAIKHLKEDALRYRHQGETPIDWLLCDVLETPEVIIEMLRKWLRQGWCRYFVVNLKLGRRDPVAVLKELRDPTQGLMSYCKTLCIRQLYHDREEITLMGEVASQP